MQIADFILMIFIIDSIPLISEKDYFHSGGAYPRKSKIFPYAFPLISSRKPLPFQSAKYGVERGPGFAGRYEVLLA
jgi:hypothetical protein